MQARLIRFLLPALAALAVACQPPLDGGVAERNLQQPQAGAAVDEPIRAGSVVEGNRTFGLTLYRQLSATPGNLFISPISIAGAFGPVIAGAKGETRDAIAGALGFPANGGAALHPELGGLLRGLEREQEGATLSIANALWVKRDFALKPAFLRTAREDYGAVAENLDFFPAREAAAARINDWVNKETRGRIPRLFAPSSFNDRTRLVVTNAVYFLGQWANAFRISETRPQPFYRPGGAIRTVPLMHRSGRYRHLWTEEFAAIDLPYKDERLSMTVFLPRDRNGLAAFEAGISPDKLADWLGKLDAGSPSKVELYLPRFEIREEYQLVEPLRAMGMGIAFTPYKANFRGMVDADLFISEAVHKTFVRVDEKGTEAAAATGVVVEAVSAPPTFRADRPFFFLLRDKATGAVLFMGRIVDPVPQ